METLTRRGFLFGAGAVAVATQVMPLADAVAWADQELRAEPEIAIARHLGRIILTPGSGPMGDGLMFAALGQQISSDPNWRRIAITVYRDTSIRDALLLLNEREHCNGEPAPIVFVPDFMRRAPEFRELAAEDPALANIIDLAKGAANRCRGRSIIIPS